jgi:hypothetical protein
VPNFDFVVVLDDVVIGCNVSPEICNSWGQLAAVHFSLLACRLQRCTLDDKGNSVRVRAVKKQETVEVQVYSFFVSVLD